MRFLRCCCLGKEILLQLTLLCGHEVDMLCDHITGKMKRIRQQVVLDYVYLQLQKTLLSECVCIDSSVTHAINRFR